MPFAVAKGEKDLAELTSRLFEIKGRSATAAMKNAEAALLKANPHLAEMSKVPEGTLVVVPELPDNPPARAAQTVGFGADLQSEAKLALKELAEVIARSADNSSETATLTQEALKSRELKDVAAQLPDIKAQLDKIGEASKNQLKNAKAEATAEKEALGQLQAALEKFQF